MTATLSVKSNIAEWSKDLDSFGKKKVPMAMAKAINASADGLQKRYKNESKKRFIGGATPYTLKGFQRMRGRGRASAKDLSTLVLVQPDQNEYLKFQAEGGMRTPKGRSILGAGKVSAALTKQGNLKRSVIDAIDKDKVKYFKGKPKGNQGSDGVWERYNKSKTYPSGRKIRQVARYIKGANYRPKFPFYKTGEQVVFGRGKGSLKKKFDREMIKILAKAGYR